MSEEPRYLPSINSIEKAFELARLDTKSWTAQDIIISAALFDAYLTGRLGVSCGINDRAPYVSDVQGDPNAIRCSFKIMENVCLRDNDALSVRLPLLLNNAEEVPDQVFSGHAYRCVHSSSPSDVSKNPASDSSSEAGTETVAPFDLSRESLATLYQLAENAQNLELLKAAALELDKRRGCDV